MKKLLFTICFLFILKLSFAQLESRYDFGNAPPLLEECNRLGVKTGNLYAPPAGYSFKILNLLNNDTAIASCLLFGKVNDSFLLIRNESDLNNYLRNNCRTVIQQNRVSQNSAISTAENNLINLRNNLRVADTILLSEVEEYRHYFLIKVSAIATHSTPSYQTWHNNKSFVIGTQAKLIKIRLKDFDFAKDFSLASTFGFRYRTSPKKDNFLSFVGSIGISLNDLDNNVAPKLADTAKIKNIGALTLGLGFIREYGKIQVSLMFGKDFLSKANQNKYNWIYNGKTWISFGVGIGIFTGDDGKKNSETDKQN